MIRRPPRSTQSRSSAASDVYKRQLLAQEFSTTYSSGSMSSPVTPRAAQCSAWIATHCAPRRDLRASWLCSRKSGMASRSPSDRRASLVSSGAASLSFLSKTGKRSPPGACMDLQQVGERLPCGRERARIAGGTEQRGHRPSRSMSEAEQPVDPVRGVSRHPAADPRSPRLSCDAQRPCAGRCWPNERDDQAGDPHHHEDDATVDRLIPLTDVVTANLRIAPIAINTKLEPILISPSPSWGSWTFQGYPGRKPYASLP